LSDPAQFNELIAKWSFVSVPLGVFIASLLGSTHCASMCGPVAAMVHGRNGYLPLYHIGRLVSYLTLGALAGLLGETVLSRSLPVVSTVSLAAVSLFLVYTGWRLVRGKSLDVIPGRLVSSVLRYPARWSLTQRKPVASLTMGIVNGFVPCGWVYIFVIGAAAAKSPLYGAALLFVFWLGTLPALTALSYAYKKGVSMVPVKAGMVAGMILIAVGLFNFAAHIVPSEGGRHVHSHGQSQSHTPEEHIHHH